MQFPARRRLYRYSGEQCNVSVALRTPRHHPIPPFTDWQNVLHLISGVDYRPSSLSVIRSRYTNSNCYQDISWYSFHWLLRRSERLCLPPRSTPAVTTTCLLPWPAYAFCWAGLLMPRARTACSLRAPRTTSRARRAPGGPGSVANVGVELGSRG